MAAPQRSQYNAVVKVGADTAGHLANRAEPKHGQGSAVRHIGILHALPGGRQNVGKKEDGCIKVVLKP
ncbi:hypothetical protein KIP68_01185 [Corynebacterium aquatimens]|uniref:Uncharacterized protein n=1 Tax=Corynebacterium aquatimens TaxID=1190508 RepID=A0A931GR49_9CORY|nr:hypothetical protein [Corynebacterium aquatimens]